MIPLKDHHTGSLERICQDFSSLGITYVGHFLRTPKGTTAFFSDPNWRDAYTKESFCQHDPYLNFLIKYQLTGVAWGEMARSKKEVYIKQRRQEICRTTQGVTFASYSQDKEEFFGLGTDSKFVPLEKLIGLNAAIRASVKRNLKTISQTHAPLHHQMLH